MEPITMMLASIGMQFYSNYKNNRKSNELWQRQEDFRKAVLNQDFISARKLQAQAAKLSLELEAETHQQRMEDIRQNYDDVLHSFATGLAVDYWPLNVLPFVMKGESFGSLFGGMSKSISIHCILTPSNCEWFNQLFFDDIDMQLESEMNSNWNAQSTHPIVYYGGGWNRRKIVIEGTRRKNIPSTINLNDIDLLYTRLRSLPTIVITPYFDRDINGRGDSLLFFRVRIWGMGQDNEYRVDVCDNRVENGQFHFTYSYDKSKEPEHTEEYLKTTISEFVQYLECLVGFLADKYFWCMYRVVPSLPFTCDSPLKRQLATSNVSRYKSFLNEFSDRDSYCKAIEFISSADNIINQNKKNEAYVMLYKLFIGRNGGIEGLNIQDLKLLKKIQAASTDDSFVNKLTQEIEHLQSKEEIRIWFCASLSEFYQRLLNTQKENDFSDFKFVYKVENDFFMMGAFVDECNRKQYSLDSVSEYAILMPTNLYYGFYTLDLPTMESSPIDKNLPFSNVDIAKVREIFRDKNNWLEKLVERHRQISDLAQGYLAKAKTLNLTFPDLVDWSKRHCESSDSVKFTLAYDKKASRYYIIGCNDEEKQVFAAYCNTIDENLANKFGNNLILTIKIK